MKVTVLRGTVYQGNKRYGPGKIVDLDDKTAGELTAAGFVSKPGAPPPLSPPSKTPEELAAEAEEAAKKAAEVAEAAAKKRKKAEEAAVKKGLGTAEEVAALSDEDLQSLFKAKK